MGKIYDALKRAEEEARLKENACSIRQRTALPGELRSLTIQDKANNISLAQNRPLKGFLSRILSASGGIKQVLQKQIPASELLFHEDSNSFIAEQFRLLRSHILKFNKLKPIRTVLVTSTQPNEGKTVTAYNLAVCIAQGINDHVLLVDSDLRKPAIHNLFGMNLNGGLSQYLSGDNALEHFLIKTAIDKLTVLPAGIPTEKPSELIASEKMRQLIQDLKSRYSDRFIIFDSSPIQQTTEPRILAELVEGIILVVSWGQTNRKLAAKCVEDLGRDKILGIVFNKSQEKSRSSQYDYSYYNVRGK